jgi:hypothetical protein
MKSALATMAFCVTFAAWPALAQLALPGAVAPESAGAVEKAPAPPKAARPAPIFKPPDTAAVIGKPLLLNGANGSLQLSRRDDAVQIDRLTLAGEVISDPAQQCRVDVVAGGDGGIALKPLGRPDGLLRFAVDMPACPFEFDVLDGAILVPPQLRACVFTEADCQASPSGLWGPAGAALQPDVKQGARARARAEAALAANYRALAAHLGAGDKADELARDQSRFSADRDEVCRTYAGESTHGFCATRLTEARAAFLKARLDETHEAGVKAKPAARRKPKPKSEPQPEPQPAQ